MGLKYDACDSLFNIKKFWANPFYKDSEEPLKAWYNHVIKREWKNPSELKLDYKSASILKNGRVVFNIAGNKYRLVVWINFPYHVVYVRFIGTHVMYDSIDVQNI